MYSIRQLNETTWELVLDGQVIGTFSDHAGGRNGYQLALLHLGALLDADRLALATAPDAPAPGENPALLAERWTSDQGIAFNELLGSGRDFSDTAWTWRDPATSMVPLMLQQVTDFAHMSAQLAGFVEEFTLDGTTPQASGRFFNNEAGVQFRDLLLGAGRMGVSVDPTENVEVDESFDCTEWDDEGFCIDGEWSLRFVAYEIGGITGTPFPAFENASVVLEGTEAEAPPAPVRAAAPVAPPRSWFTLTEPQLGEPFLDGMGEDVLVDQFDRANRVIGQACPFTITELGQVYGHLTFWGQCHTGNPWGPNRCASATRSANGYADFLTGETITLDGTRVPTGVLTVGCEHSWAMDCAGVRDYLAHAGTAFANVRITDGEFGPWVAGAIRPDVTDRQLAALRGLALSGEWVGELAGILAVNRPGLPLQRRQLAASAFGAPIGEERLQATWRGDTIVRATGLNIVRRCAECERRAREAGAGRERPYGAAQLGALDHRIGNLERLLTLVEARTRHLVPAAVHHALEQVQTVGSNGRG